MSRLMKWLKRMSEKLKAKSKNKLASILPNSTYLQDTSNAGKASRRNSMPASRASGLQRFPPLSPTDSGYFTSHPSPATNTPDGTRPRTLSIPNSLATPSSCRVRIPRRSISPTSSPSQVRRIIGLSAREQRVASERRAVTRESEQCGDELIQEGIKVRDFQTEHNEAERRKVAMSSVRKGVKVDLPSQDGGSGAVSEVEMVMRGRAPGVFKGSAGSVSNS